MKRMILGLMLMAGLFFLGCDEGGRRGYGPHERGGSYDRGDHGGDRGDHDRH